MKTVHGIQYLRAVAALAVVLFHATEKTGQHFKIGAAGVDIFFVISGFIMWTMSRARPITPGRFLVDRIRRIVPSYWLVTLVMIIGALVHLFPNLRLTAGHILGSLFFVPVRSPSNGEVWPVLVQGWTLNFEMFFYVLFAGTLFLPRRWQLTSLCTIFLAFVIAGALFTPESPMLQTYTRPIILEFVVGVLIGQLWLSGKIVPAPLGLAFVGASLCGFIAIYLLGAEFDEFICGPLAAALVYGVVSLEKADKIPVSTVLTYLGNSSYSIYLWHTLAISVVVKAAQVFAVPVSVTLPAAVISGTLLGTAAYECAEKPLRKLLSAKGRLVASRAEA